MIKLETFKNLLLILINMIIDGTNLILGRLAAFVAKRALEGEPIIILNCENVIITGNKDFLIRKFKERLDRGHPYHGPFFPKLPDRIVKRTIRGMLPYKQERGKKAFKKIKCYRGVPENYKSAKTEIVPVNDVKKLKTLNYITVNNLSSFVGKGVV